MIIITLQIQNKLSKLGQYFNHSPQFLIWIHKCITNYINGCNFLWVEWYIKCKFKLKYFIGNIF